MRNRSVLKIASRVLWTELRYCTTPIVASSEISVITISSSMSVKPSWRRTLKLDTFIPYQSRYFVPSRAVPCDLQYTS
jgi:hypothetical protein